MKKIIIHCASGINNIGDEAILDVMVKYIQEYGDVSVISLNAKNTLKFHPEIQAINDFSFSALKIIKHCDLFILGGGGLLQDETTLFNITRWLAKLFLAVLLKKKTAVFANSVGPINYRVNKILVRFVLNRVDLISVREESSKLLLERIGVKKDIQICPDPAFYFESDLEIDDQVIDKYNLPQKFCVISLRHWYDTIPILPVKINTFLNIRSSEQKHKYNILVQNIVKTVDFLNSTFSLPVVFIPFCLGRDQKICEDVLAKVTDKTKNTLINNEFLSTKEVYSIINMSSCVIGMRLHSLIMAIDADKPFIALSYSKKVKDLMTFLGFLDSVIDISDFNLESMIVIDRPYTYQT